MRLYYLNAHAPVQGGKLRNFMRFRLFWILQFCFQAFSVWWNKLTVKLGYPDPTLHSLHPVILQTWVHTCNWFISHEVGLSALAKVFPCSLTDVSHWSFSSATDCSSNNISLKWISCILGESQRYSYHWKGFLIPTWKSSRLSFSYDS